MKKANDFISNLIRNNKNKILESLNNYSWFKSANGVFENNSKKIQNIIKQDYHLIREFIQKEKKEFEMVRSKAPQAAIKVKNFVQNQISEIDQLMKNLKKATLGVKVTVVDADHDNSSLKDKFKSKKSFHSASH